MRLVETHIEVDDVDRSLSLYKKLIKHVKIVRWGEPEKPVVALILEDGSAFGLWTKGTSGIHGGRGASHQHYAFLIKPEEYDRYFNLIAENGLKPMEHIWDTGDKSVYFFDYDGHQGEFITADWLALNPD